MLIHNQINGLYGGVNQQSAEHRLESQVEEMINAYPTIYSGLLKRNPTEKLALNGSISYSSDMYSYAYDRGVSGVDEEKYAVNILATGIEIVNVITGDVYTEASGLTYDGTSKTYITSKFGGVNGYASTTIKDTTFISNKLISPQIKTGTPVSSTHLKEAYIWIKSSNPSSAYTYDVVLTDSLGNTLTATATDTTTTAAATTLAAAIDLDANFSATAIGTSATSAGSVVKVTGLNNITSVEATDSYGNQASFGWTYTVQYNIDLPKNLGFANTVVKVTGSGISSFATYWLKYVDGQWAETSDPEINNQIDETTMPHVLVRNTDGSFTLKTYLLWKDMLVGDNDSNPLPSFIETVDNVAPTIKDIFFFKNRLGFMTSRTVIMSEVGEYGNFFRTTTGTLLDSDYIDATVDTTTVISLEYATYLEDSMLLFSDKAQFKLSGGKILSPKDVQISKTSAYEINVNVRPLFMNDKVFFCATRGEYTAVMQYEIKATNSTSEAVDISAHIQSYIPSTVSKLSGSPINNMLFLTTGFDNTIYVYKYYDSGADRVQSAWFKWTYNGNIYSAFSLGRNLNILINRLKPIAVTNWILGSGTWDMSKPWDNSLVWVMSPASLAGQNAFETSPIFPQDYTGNFQDDFTTVGNETIIPTDIKIGEWVSGSKSVKDTRGHLLFKTVQISSEDGSDFELGIENLARNTNRIVKSKYTVDRKPMVYGNAKDTRISIINNSINGFRINTISYEGNLNSRSKRRV